MGLGGNADSLRLLSGEFDGDLNADFAAISPVTNQLVVYLGVGDGTFSSPSILSSGGSQPISIALGNFVGDAFSDIAIGHADGVISLLENENGVFNLRPDLAQALPSAVRDLSASDFDADGDDDLVVASGDSVTILQNDQSELALPAVVDNSSFAEGLRGWNVETVGHQPGRTAGMVIAQSGFVQLVENESFLVSINQELVLPASPQTLEIDILSLGLDDPGGGIPDAFEISFLDADRNSLVPTSRSDATSFFNINPAGDVKSAAGVTFDGRTVTLDISTLPAGTTGTLFLDLVGSGPGTGSTVTIDNIRVTPENEFDHSFSPTTLTGPFVGANQLAIADVDGDERPDIVVTDKGADLVLVFNQQADSSFIREEVDVSNLGTGLVSLATAPLTDGDSVSDIVVVANDNGVVISPLESDVEAPTAELVSPLPAQTNTGDVTRIDIRFSELMRDLGESDPFSVTNSNNYTVIFVGPDGVAGSPDDLTIAIESVDYEPLTGLVTLNIDLASPPLEDGVYQVDLSSQNLRDVSDNPLAEGQSVSFEFTMNSVGPAIEPIAPVSAVEGSVVQLLADFTDAGGTTPYTAEIDWGDGSITSASIVNFNAGVGMIGASHIYADNGSYDIMVTILDAENVASQAFTSATVNNAAPVAVAIENPGITIVRGQEFNFQLANFSDVGFDNITTGTSEDFTATIDWGDGTSSSGVVDFSTGMPGLPSTGDVGGTHTYAAEGDYTITITVLDDDGGQDQVELDVTVSTDAPVISPIGQVNAGEGSQVDLQTSFTDLGDSSSFAATIVWGDGVTEAATVTFANGSGTVSASHVYADNGDYPITIELEDASGNVSQSEGVATISNIAPLIAVATTQSAVVGQEIELVVATFVDPGFSNILAATEETFSVLIDWGDGTISTDATILVENGSAGTETIGSIEASHQYLTTGAFDVLVRVTDDDGSFSEDTFAVNVSPATQDDGVWLPAIDFETNAVGNSLSRGAIVADQWADWGRTHYNA